MFPKRAQHLPWCSPFVLAYHLVLNRETLHLNPRLWGETRPLLADPEHVHMEHPSCALTGGSVGREVAGNPDLGASPTSLSQGSLNRRLLF